MTTPSPDQPPAERYAKGGFIPGPAAPMTLLVVDHGSGECDDPLNYARHIHAEECIIRPNPLRCVRTDDLHRRTAHGVT